MAATRRSGLLTMTRPRLVLIAVALLGVGLLLLLPDSRPGDASDADSASSPASGLLAVELATFEGDTVRLSSYADGRPLVVNFFASWCGPCVREMPDFEAVHLRRGDEVRFVGISLQETPRAALELVAQTGVTYDIARDVSGSLFRAVNGFSMPTTVFLAPDGTVVEVHGGELSQRALEAMIDRLVAR
jgi:cytochrome c biogenesis protein CcmG/thiol:disulfide interchange protein DsbE